MKVLMVTMGLGIGGAETHIVELVKQLKKQGYDLAVVSNGGVYVPEIEAAGIRHYQAPLHQRKGKAMLTSYRRLAEILDRERPDIVHAHARIPAFLCQRLCKRRHIPFVTTAHWVFETGGGLRYLTCWGQKTVAVSEDIKEYLIQNYNTRPENIFVTVNGIDTDKFSPEISGERAARELGIETDKPVLTCVSRMDESRALVPQQLIEIAPRLDQMVPGIQLLLVGGGDRLELLQAKADKINTALGRKAVFLPGPRTDINELVALGDIFVGVSRAALEAMAAGKPVVVAGNEGYIGLFTEEKLECARENNFCCRGCEQSDGDKLTADIVRCFRATPEERAALGSYGRGVVMEYYSVRRMAEDCIQAYQAALPPKRIAVCGYYGFENTGDEAILQSVQQNIRQWDDKVELVVLSNTPEATRRRYGCQAVSRFHIFAVLHTLRKCDLLLFGGGSLLQDRTSTRSLVYYVSVVRLAKLLGKKIMFYANGIGPVSRPANRRRVKKAAMCADVITLRDQDSARELEDMGVPPERFQVTADPALSITPAGKDRAWELLGHTHLPEQGKFVVVAVRPWPAAGKIPAQLALLCDHIVEKYGYHILLLAMQPSRDQQISREIRASMKNKTAAYLLAERYPPQELMSILAQAELVISMRLHALLFAARVATPMVGLVYDPKVESCLKQLGMPSAGEVTNLEDERLRLTVEDVLDHRQAYYQELEQISASLRQQTKINEQLLFALLGKR